MTEKTTSPPAPDAELAKNIATIKRGVEAKVAAIKRDLAQRLDDTLSPGDPAEIALLELACERYLAIHENTADAFDLIQAVFRRAVSKRNGSLQ
ncbi:MAG: hypothetical protein WB611_04510 [Stellaceae bacterium]